MRRRFVESKGFSEGIYYLDLPGRGVCHLVAIFGKGEKADLSQAERKAIAGLVERLKEGR